MFMAPPARLTPVTAVIHERGQRGGFHKAGGGKGPSSDDDPHACGAAACKGPSPITKARPSQINYSAISVERAKKLMLAQNGLPCGSKAQLPYGEDLVSGHQSAGRAAADCSV